jgi:hypothetical protein
LKVRRKVMAKMIMKRMMNWKGKGDEGVEEKG